MGYIQIILNQQYLARDLLVNPEARIEGYPGYLAIETNDPGLVRTILYEDNGIIYITQDKKFILTLGENISLSNGEMGNSLIFSSNPYIIPFTLDTLISTYGASYRDWNAIWANQSTDDPMRTGLIWPSQTWQESWQIMLDKQYPVAFRGINPKPDPPWISVVDSYGRESPIQNTGSFASSTIGAALAWRSRPYLFNLLQKGSEWGLMYLGYAIPDANEFFAGSTSGQARTDLWVKSWDYNDANRWLFTSHSNRILYFNTTMIDTNSYAFIYQSKPLIIGGYWELPLGLFGRIYDGVEFYKTSTKSPMPVSINIVSNSLSDLDRYRLGQNIFVTTWIQPNTQYPMWKPENITANMPKGTGICTSTQWTGSQIGCYESNIPYPTTIGKIECTTLDDFSNDIHCREWAIANRDSSIDNLFTSLCTSQYPQHEEICKCYWPDNIYYNAIVKRNNQTTAEALKTTNLLQCASGLCVPDGSFSSSVYYRGTRRCDVCVQSLSVDLAGATIGGNVNLREICTIVDITYTWEDLIQRLESLGASRIVQSGNTFSLQGINRNIIINKDKTAITIIKSDTLSRYPFLANIPNKDINGNPVLTRQIWSTNSTKYSTQLLAYFLETRVS